VIHRRSLVSRAGLFLVSRGWGVAVAASPVLAALVLLGPACTSSSTPEKPVDCSSVADTTMPATVSYRTHILPIISAETYRCQAAGCHGGGLASSSYALDSYDGIMGQGDEAKLLKMCDIKPGDPDNSYLVWKIEGDPRILTGTVRMPNGCETSPDPNDCLSQAEIDTIRTWILEGARDN
jgi:hypothetical protein